jgi:hypothetical protein
MDSIDLKAGLLADGMVLSEAFLNRYGPPYLEKRRAYGNPDPEAMRAITIPQEIYLGADRLVTSVNVRPSSRWTLDWSNGFGCRGPGVDWAPIDFPRRPLFYDAETAAGDPVSRIITLYGGGALGIFIYGNCALVDMGKACHYCSIAPNRTSGVDFEKVISADQVEQALRVALADEACGASQVMINGGNFPDTNKSFRYYLSICAAARRAIDASGRTIELHLIVFPPTDLELLDELRGLDLSVAMNCEVFTPELFARYCPGKTVVAGQAHLFAALRRAAQNLGEGRVFSIIVGGLEPTATTRAGMERLATDGVTPVINVFHADPGTPLASHPVPTADRILELGLALEDVYTANAFMRPFYLDCGRNSLDTEASRSLFSRSPEAAGSPPAV